MLFLLVIWCSYSRLCSAVSIYSPCWKQFYHKVRTSSFVHVNFFWMCKVYTLLRQNYVSVNWPFVWYGHMVWNKLCWDSMQWDFQNKVKSSWTGKSSLILIVPLCYLRPSVIYSVPCDRILQRAYFCDSPGARFSKAPGTFCARKAIFS